MFIKLQHSCLDILTGDQWVHTKLHYQACLQKILAPDRHTVEALSRPSSSGNISTPLFCCKAVSLLTQHSNKSLAEDVAALLIPQLIGLVV